MVKASLFPNHGTPRAFNFGRYSRQGICESKFGFLFAGLQGLSTMAILAVKELLENKFGFRVIGRQGLPTLADLAVKDSEKQTCFLSRGSEGLQLPKSSQSRTLEKIS